MAAGLRVTVLGGISTGPHEIRNCVCRYDPASTYIGGGPMKQREILDKCEAEYVRLMEAARAAANVGAIYFWENCEEVTSNLLLELESSFETLPPNEECKSIKTKLLDLNRHADSQVRSAEQLQRDNR